MTALHFREIDLVRFAAQVDAVNVYGSMFGTVPLAAHVVSAADEKSVQRDRFSSRF